MRKTIIGTFAILVLFLVGCEKELIKIHVDPNTYTIEVDESVQISYSVESVERGLVLEFISSDETIVEVDNGQLTGKKAGEATVTIQLEIDPSIYATIQVIVLAKTPEISLKDETLLMLELEQYTIEYTLTNGEATDNVLFSSSDETVATVNEDGVITALKDGEVLITVSLERSPAINQTLMVVVESLPMEIIFDKENINLIIPQTHVVLYSILHEKGEVALSLSSSDETIVRVNDLEIEAVQVGTAIITATIVGTSITASFEVTVEYPEVDITLGGEWILYETEEKPLIATIVGGLGTESLVFVSENPEIAIIENGNIARGLKEGAATILISIPEAGFAIFMTLIVEKLAIKEIEITSSVDQVYLLEDGALSATIYPLIFNQEITWSSSDESILSIDQQGNMTSFKSGSVIITVTSVEDPTQGASMNIEVKADPLKALAALNQPNPIKQYVTTYGATQQHQWVYGSVNKFFSSTLNLVENFVPINENPYTGMVATRQNLAIVEPLNKVRPGIYHPETKYIIYHDTGNNTPGANALMHANYLVSSANENNRARSWHYSVDDIQIIQHIPDNEVTWQGDSFESYGMGIGIETTVHYGSDLYTTWQRTAKLIAQLLVKHQIGMDGILQHYDTSGKNCPQTLRRSNLYNHAIDLVRAEYLMLTEFSSYTTQFISLSPEYVDNRGRVIALPETATRIGYTVRAFRAGYNQSTILYSTLPGLDGTTTVEASEEALEAAKVFDLQVLRLPTTVTANSEPVITAAREAYESLSEEAKGWVTMYNRLLEKEYQLYSAHAVETTIVLNQLFVSNQMEGSFAFDYIELYNTSLVPVDISGWSIKYQSNEQEQIFVLPEGTMMKSRSSYLILFNQGDEKDIDPTMPLADLVFIGEFDDENGSFTLRNKQLELIDLVGYGPDATEYEDSPIINFGEKAMIRLLRIDTNRNHKDFLLINPAPRNQYGETFAMNATADHAAAKLVDIHISLLNRALSLEDEDLVLSVVSMCEGLTSAQQAYCTQYDLLYIKQLEIEGLQDPKLRVINEAILQVPSQILFNFSFPTDTGVEWRYKTGEDATYFDLHQGIHLKRSFEAKYTSIIASYQGEEKEIIVNFGIAAENENLVFSTGMQIPNAGGQTSAGNGTMQEQLNTSGFGGVAVSVDGKVYFIGKDAYIPLVRPATGNFLTQEMLRPRGQAASDWYNMGLVSGVAVNYSGSGALYHNTSDIDLVFNISHTYGRNNAAVYGYYKVIFRLNEQGNYIVQQGLDNSGTDNTAGTTTVTLRPGDFLWTPHTYETNLNGGTWFMQGGLGGSVGVLVPGSVLEIRFFKNS